MLIYVKVCGGGKATLSSLWFKLAKFCSCLLVSSVPHATTLQTYALA